MLGEGCTCGGDTLESGLLLHAVMGALKLLAGVALIAFSVFFMLPISMHLVSTRMTQCSHVLVVRKLARERDPTFEASSRFKYVTRFAL